MGATPTRQPARSGPAAAPKERHIWLIVLVIIFALLFIGFVGFRYVAAGEEICTDRWPWWGPPENPDTTCSGHIYERLRKWGGPPRPGAGLPGNRLVE
jgi:hypothetical protein